MLLALILLVSGLGLNYAARPADSAVTLHHWEQLGTGFRSDLGPESVTCYDSDRRVPVYLTDANIAGQGQGYGGAKKANGVCKAYIYIERGPYNSWPSKTKNYFINHEKDHTRGWGHTEGSTPNHNCTRTSGENAANPRILPPASSYGTCTY